MPITVAARSKAWNTFVCSNNGIVGSNLTRCMRVCPSLFCVCVVLCKWRSCDRADVLPIVYKKSRFQISSNGKNRSQRPLRNMTKRNFYDLLYGALFSWSIASNGRMTWEIFGRQRSWPNNGSITDLLLLLFYLNFTRGSDITIRHNTQITHIAQKNTPHSNKTEHTKLHK
jgi:hypothetical protein